MGDRQPVAAVAADLGQQGPDPGLDLARALAAGGAEIEAAALDLGHRRPQLGPEIAQAAAFPFPEAHLDQARLHRGLAMAQQSGGLPRPQQRAGQPGEAGDLGRPAASGRRPRGPRARAAGRRAPGGGAPPSSSWGHGAAKRAAPWSGPPGQVSAQASTRARSRIAAAAAMSWRRRTFSAAAAAMAARRAGCVDQGAGSRREGARLAGRRQQAGDPVGDDRGHAAHGPGHHGQAGGLGLQQRHAIGLVHRGPEAEVGGGVAAGDLFLIEAAQIADPPGPERGQRRLDLGPGRAVADDQKLPVEIEERRQRLAQDPVGGELVARAHHGDGEQPGLAGIQPMARGDRPARRRAGAGEAAEFRQIEEGRQLDQAMGQGDQGLQPLPVRRVDDEDPRRRPQRRGGGVMAQGIGAAGALAGDGGLGDQIGDGERPGDVGPQPVRRLVIEVIGEPGRRALGGRAGGIEGQQRAGARRPRRPATSVCCAPSRPAAGEPAGELDLMARLLPGLRSEAGPCAGRRRGPDGRAASAARRRLGACRRRCAGSLAAS